jgi:hypothetical protein
MGRADDVADSAGIGGDVLEGAPAGLFPSRKSLFSGSESPKTLRRSTQEMDRLLLRTQSTME